MAVPLRKCKSNLRSPSKMRGNLLRTLKVQNELARFWAVREQGRNTYINPRVEVEVQFKPSAWMY